MSRNHWRSSRPARDLEQVGLVVVDPVADIADAGFGQIVERVPSFGQAGAEPADRRLPDAASMRSIVARTASRSCALSISVSRSALGWLRLISSQPSRPA